MKLQVWLIWIGVVATAVPADGQCESDEFQCADRSRCINASWFCDGDEDCQDGTDESRRNVNSDFYDENSTFCRGWDGHICVVQTTLLPNVRGFCDEDWRCTSDEFPCADGSRCIPGSFFCDGDNECRDGSDETKSNVNRDFYDENSIFCRGLNGHICVVPKTLLSNVTRFCDEDGQCESDEFQCADRSRCINATSFCDGYEDCQDGSDESRRNVNSDFSDENSTFCRGQWGHICVVPKTLLPNVAGFCDEDWRCTRDEFPCADGSRCIPGSLFCDGDDECRDGSDETKSNVNRDFYNEISIFCRGLNGHICVIPKILLSNVRGFCVEDGQCESDQFQCADRSRCINATSFCDGYEDCKDGSDESRRNVNDFYDENTTFCRGQWGHICVVPKTLLPNVVGFCDEDWRCTSDEFPCADGSRCIPARWFCNGDDECRDGSDEPRSNVNSDFYDENATFCRGLLGHICVVPNTHLPNVRGFCDEDWRCKSDEFPCADGSRCIPAVWFCNGRDHCRDGSDETRRNVNDFYHETSTFCRGLFGHFCVVPKTLLSNVTGFCDEDLRCKSDEFPCADGSRCIPERWFCNGNNECRDGSDEYPLRNIIHSKDPNSIYCRGDSGHICTIPKISLLQVKGVCEMDWECKSNEFQCVDGSRCIEASRLCDGGKDCLDWSDEILRSRTRYKANEIYQEGFNRICAIPNRNSEFKEELCAIKNDSCTCRHHEKYIEKNGCFRCLSNPHYVLQVSQLCDGIVDCPDISDECLCPSKSQLGICQSIVVGNDPRPNVHIICRSGNGSTLIVDEIGICDKRQDCPDGKDEKGCVKNDTSPISTQQACPIRSRSGYVAADLCDDLEYLRRTEPLLFERCYDYYIGRNGERRCDGKTNCNSEVDEKYCNATRFYCTDGPFINIPLEKRCDLHDDCDDGSDEKNCTDHFYCEDNGMVKYVPLSSVSDGVADCESGSDECVFVDSVFSDQESLISNEIVLAFVWIISLSAIFGCFAVIGRTVFDFVRNQNSNIHRPSDHVDLFKILIMSLSISDFLVGVYTLIICVKALQLDHDYCQTDRVWRGSSTCSSLGVILVLGSEQSVFTMVLIAAVRTYFVWRPFSQPNLRVVVFSVLVTWIISIILATVPLISSAEDYFVKDIQFNRNILLKVVSTYEVPYKIKWLSLMPEARIVGDTNWSKLKNLALTVNPSTTFIEYGYYSSHTVCLPTLFPDPTEEPAWGYTLFLILVNFLAFLAMLILYAILYRMASRRKVLQESVNARERLREANARMQRKLTRIVASDFLCWIPICIMGFLQIMGVPIPRDLYLPAGLLIIPINSALNPLLYSDIPELVWQKLKELKNKVCPSAADEPPVIIEMQNRSP